MNNFSDNSDSLYNQQKKYTRRQAIGLGVIGMLALSGFNLATSREILLPSYRPRPLSWSNSDLTIAWLGHASFLINFFGTRILIDPALENHIGLTPLGDFTIGPKRYVSSPLTSKEVGEVDLILVSHAHTDHFDYPTLRSFQSPKVIGVTAKNTLSLWKGLNFNSIEEMHWQEEKNLKGVAVKAIEGKHWGARLPWYKGMEANSFLISKNGINIFYGGDTGYTEIIKNQLNNIPIHIAIMGIAAYSPKSFEARHATPEQAWQIANEISAKWVIPMHWGTFKLSQEPMDEPMKRFRAAAGGLIESVPIQEIGATWVMPK